MRGIHAAVVIALGLILGVPFIMRPRSVEVRRDAATIVIVTPHVQQIRSEFGEAFSRWHERVYKEPIAVDWRTPGGTSDIRKQLEAQYAALAKSGRFKTKAARTVSPAEKEQLTEIELESGAVAFDAMLGGGSYDHRKLKEGVVVSIGDRRVRVRMSRPATLTARQLEAIFGENKIGTEQLYDEDQFWLGTALSSFGIVYNRRVLRDLGLPEPASFEDLADPRYAGSVALSDPRQSSSVETSINALLDNYGWERGWRILRAMCANTRYFTNSSTKPPQDVAAGEAAAGLAIDFYGRGQADATMAPGETPATARVGYVDPPGTTFVDADPISLLAGAPHPELADRFAEFCLTDEGQALWQLAANDTPKGETNPIAEDGRPLGPSHHQLRRMPIRRDLYSRFQRSFVDDIDPFARASKERSRGWRDSIKIMMASFAIDIADEQRAAWAAIARARARTGFPAERIAEMERVFFDWPEHDIWPEKSPSAGQRLRFTAENYKPIREAWRDPAIAARSRIAYTAFFRDCYRRVVAIEAGKP
ncbi:MAG: ABC transporter substrate-binding protein [Phycisphaerales bacterium]